MPDITLLLAVLVLAIGTYSLRLGGVNFGGSPAASRFEQWSEPAVIVLLASVATTATIYDGEDFAGWARLSGVVVAAGLSVVRAPLVVVVAAAAGVTAGLRVCGVA